MTGNGDASASLPKHGMTLGEYGGPGSWVAHYGTEPNMSYSLTPEESAALRAQAAAANAEAKAHTRNPDAADLIGQERRRQIMQEGWTPEHDAEHANGDLIKAAVTYAREALWAVQHPDVEFDPTLALTIRDHQGTPASTWPWEAKWWKPSPDPVRNLVKAGALVAAEIDRLIAARGPSGPLLPAPEFTDCDAES